MLYQYAICLIHNCYISMLYVWYIMTHTMIYKRYDVKNLAWIFIECESMMIDHVSSISTLFKL